jgi:lauroyl/myristoyl acyltransferase
VTETEADTGPPEPPAERAESGTATGDPTVERSTARSTDRATATGGGVGGAGGAGGVDLVTPAYRAAAALAQRLPAPVVEQAAPHLASLWALRPSDRRRMVERHQRRVEPWLRGGALRRRVREVYRSYGRYYAESFRLPAVSEAELDARLSVDGYELFERAFDGGLGPILVLPHLGSWEWCGFWLARVRGIPVTVVVEQLEPPALFEWFADFRRQIGMHVVPVGPDAARAVNTALKARHAVALLCDRNVGQTGGVEVELFGERTLLPAGPATLARRTGATVLPVAIYDRPGGRHHAVVKPPLDTSRRASLREDVARITQDMAHALEELIRAAPEQWHLLQPNWPSDRTPFKL